MPRRPPARKPCLGADYQSYCDGRSASGLRLAQSRHSNGCLREWCGEGRKAFHVLRGITECHGRQAQGGVGPHLGPGPISFAAFLRYVRHPSASMPPYTEKVVTDQELTDIYAFLKSLPEPSKAKDIPLLNE